MERVVYRMLPDRSLRWVQPFHVSLEGLKTAIICRDEEDYDALTKILCICAWRKNVIVIIYAVVSNHAHVAVLAINQRDADSYANELKRMTGMWIRKRYGHKEIMKHVDAKAIWMDSDWYVRNALAYIPRNALDNGCRVNEYPWSGYRAMFCDGFVGQGPFRKVADLTKREKALIMHTCDDLSGVPWLLDAKGHLVPRSICDHVYLEQAFEGDQPYFLRTIGCVNAAEMHQKLIEGPRIMVADSEFLKLAEDTCQRWFKSNLANVPMDKRIRLITYLKHTTKTSIPQLSRIFGLDRETVTNIVKR